MIEQAIVGLPLADKGIDRPVSIYLVYLPSLRATHSSTAGLSGKTESVMREGVGFLPYVNLQHSRWRPAAVSTCCSYVNRLARALDDPGRGVREAAMRAERVRW